MHKITAFPFEGIFKICKSFIHGCRGYSNQIQKNISLNQSLNHCIDAYYDEINDTRIQHLLKKFGAVHIKDSNLHRTEKIVTVNDLHQFVQNWFLSHGFSSKCILQQCDKMIINGFEYSKFLTENPAKRGCNSIVMFTEVNVVKFGRVIEIYKHDTNIYFFIQLFETKNPYFIKSRKKHMQIANEILNRFFYSAKIESGFTIINGKDILAKCLCFDYSEVEDNNVIDELNFLLTPLVDIEHD